MPSTRRQRLAAAIATVLTVSVLLIFAVRSPTKTSDQPRSPAPATADPARGDEGDLP
jgi:hypothetical protein